MIRYNLLRELDLRKYKEQAILHGADPKRVNNMSYTEQKEVKPLNAIQLEAMGFKYKRIPKGKVK